jgi:phosphatidylserine/phosphatidylglycerophosphate/cardiolipin synthase-like enzyme
LTGGSWRLINVVPSPREQTLYDLIANAKREILMVTFAAAKIERLTGELWKAAKVGVKIRLVLEFEEASEGQLSYDAMKAFPAALIQATQIYYWPVEKRERNLAAVQGNSTPRLQLSTTLRWSPAPISLTTRSIAIWRSASSSKMQSFW